MNDMRFNKFDMLLDKVAPVELHRRKLEKAYMKKCRDYSHHKSITQDYGLLDLGGPREAVGFVNR